MSVPLTANIKVKSDARQQLPHRKQASQQTRTNCATSVGSLAQHIGSVSVLQAVVVLRGNRGQRGKGLAGVTEAGGVPHRASAPSALSALQLRDLCRYRSANTTSLLMLLMHDRTNERSIRTQESGTEAAVGRQYQSLGRMGGSKVAVEAH